MGEKTIHEAMEELLRDLIKYGEIVFIELENESKKFNLIKIKLENPYITNWEF